MLLAQFIQTALALGETGSQAEPTLTQKLVTNFPTYVAALVILILSVGVAKIISVTVKHKIIHHHEDEEKRSELAILTARLTFIVVVIIGIVVSLDIAGVLGNLGWLLGSIGLGVGLGFKNIIANFFAGLGILMQDKTSVGDILEIKNLDIFGKLVDIRSRTSIIRQFDGIEIVVPNLTFFENPMKVYTSNPFRRLSIFLGVGYDTDFAQAEKITYRICEGRPEIEKEPAPMMLVSEVQSSTVLLELRCWIRSNLNWWKVKSDLLTEWFNTCQKEGVAVSFPITTLRVDKHESAELYKFISKEKGEKTIDN